MKTKNKPKQLFLNHFRARARRFRWAGLALWLGLLNLALAADDPAITRQPTNLSVSLRAPATFRVNVSGTSPFGYQWHYTNSGNSFPLDGVANPSALRNILNLTNVQSSDSGGYFIVVTNAVGSATSQVATLTVDPTFIKITTGAIVTDREATVRATWCDYDGDGFQDLFVANYNSGGVLFGKGPASKNSLYHNNGDGTFTKITTNALSATLGWWSTGAWADVDNDGDLDLYAVGVETFSQSKFYRNDGNGRFTMVSIAPTVDPAGFYTWFVSWGDYDNDGWVDLFIPTDTQLPSHRLFRNLGDLNFRSMTAAEVGGLVDPNTHAYSPLARAFPSII